MRLGHLVVVVGLVGIAVGAGMAAEGCTVTTASCTASTCPGFDGGYVPPGSDDSGTASDDSATVVTDASFPEDTGSTPPDPCNSCLYGQCVGAYSNCVANGSCLSIYQCATSAACAADGGTCVQGCFNGGDPTGQALYLALGDCDLTAQCPNSSAACFSLCNPTAEACTVPDGGSEDGGAIDAGTDAGGGTCPACQASFCNAQLANCAAGTPCATYNQCVLGCTDQTCATACQNDDAAGFTAATALGSCTSTNCAAQCN
jgi:hypothetical protein